MVKRASEYSNANTNGNEDSPRKTEKLVNVIFNEG